MSIKVSVVVPVYNTADFLRKCLDSLTHQTLKEIEILVIDNNSTDESPAIIAEYAKRHPKKIRALKCAEWGAGATRNLGMKKATGEYIGFVDPDDFVSKEMFAAVFAVEHIVVLQVFVGTDGIRFCSGRIRTGG